MSDERTRGLWAAVGLPIGTLVGGLLLAGCGVNTYNRTNPETGETVSFARQAGGKTSFMLIHCPGMQGSAGVERDEEGGTVAQTQGCSIAVETTSPEGLSAFAGLVETLLRR